MYNTNSQIKSKTSILRSSLCDYRDPYILVSVTITVAEVAVGGGNNGIQLMFKSCAPFTNCMSEINNTKTDNAKKIDVVMPMHNVIEYSDTIQKN